jgi:phosphoribosylanthranilate isomerase
MTAPRVKICGLTRLEDAELAVALGAWSIGLIFADSPRRCDPHQGREIASTLRRKALVTGVFVNAPLDEVIALADHVGFEAVQLHGDEGPSFAAEVARRTGAKVIKAVRVGDVGDVRALDAFRNVDYHLVDGPGKGQTVDPALLRHRRSPIPLILAGGLTADNVAGQIEAIEPYAVDVASGVEASPGVKDHDLLEAFFAAVGGATVPSAR